MRKNSRSPKEVLAAADPKVQKVVNEILSTEREFLNFKDPNSAGKEKEIAQRIRSLIEREVKR